MSLVTKDSHFIFGGTLNEQIYGVAMGSSLDPTLVNTFLVYLTKKKKKKKKKRLERCPLEYRSFYHEGTLMIHFYLIHQNI